MPHVHKTQLTLDVEVEYRILPPEGDLPQQIDITGVFPLLSSTESSRVRRSNILHSMTESELINLEDEIEEEQHQ
jgi:hypothetical protein